MSNDRYSAGALLQRLHGLMSCAGPEQRFNFLFFSLFSFSSPPPPPRWLREEAGLARRGLGLFVIFLPRWVAVAGPKGSGLGGRRRDVSARSCGAFPPAPEGVKWEGRRGMTEQKGERSGGKAQLIPGGWEGGREALRGQSRVLPFTIIVHVSVASGACRNPPGHPPAAGPHRHGKPRRGAAFRCGDSPLPGPRQRKGSLAGKAPPVGIPTPAKDPWVVKTGDLAWATACYWDRACFRGKRRGFSAGRGGLGGAVRLGCAGSEPGACGPRGGVGTTEGLQPPCLPSRGATGLSSALPGLPSLREGWHRPDGPNPVPGPGAGCEEPLPRAG